MIRKSVTMIGFAGDSGAGKSTYVRALTSLLGSDRVTVIGLDDYHTLDRAQRKAVGITPLNPRCNDLGLVIDHTWQMKRGEPITKPIYDHGTGELTGPETVTPREFVVLEGLHPLYLEMQRAALDLKVYFDTDLELKLRWKIKRDVADRGHTVEQVKREIEQRQPDIRAFVEPQKKFADLIITLAPKEGSDTDIKVILMEQPANNNISTQLVSQGWIQRLGVRTGTASVNDYPFEVLELAEPVPAETVESLLGSLGVGDLPVPAPVCDPVALSHLLVTWRISTCRKSSEVLSSYVAQG